MREGAGKVVQQGAVPRGYRRRDDLVKLDRAQYGTMTSEENANIL